MYESLQDAIKAARKDIKDTKRRILLIVRTCEEMPPHDLTVKEMLLELVSYEGWGPSYEYFWVDANNGYQHSSNYLMVAGDVSSHLWQRSGWEDIDPFPPRLKNPIPAMVREALQYLKKTVGVCGSESLASQRAYLLKHTNQRTALRCFYTREKCRPFAQK